MRSSLLALAIGLSVLCSAGCRNGNSSSNTSATGGTRIAPGEIGRSNVASNFLQGEGDLWVLQVPEEGKRDLNGDGDMIDLVVHVYDVATDEMTNLGFVGAAEVHGSLVYLLASEFFRFEDLNGDGDQLDQILFVFDPRTRFLTKYDQTNFDGLGATTFAVVGSRVFYVVLEQGRDDLDGDGRKDGNVLHWIDLAVRDPQPVATKLAVNVVGAVTERAFGIQVIETRSPAI